MPWQDWQFWVVTAVAAYSVRLILGLIFPARGEGDGPACGGCATGAAACARPQDEPRPASDLPVVAPRR